MLSTKRIDVVPLFSVEAARVDGEQIVMLNVVWDAVSRHFDQKGVDAELFLHYE